MRMFEHYLFCSPASPEKKQALEVVNIIHKNQGDSDVISKRAGDLLPLQCGQTRCYLPRQEGYIDISEIQANKRLREPSCVFCALKNRGRLLLVNELAIYIADAYSVSKGHSLVILCYIWPRR